MRGVGRESVAWLRAAIVYLVFTLRYRPWRRRLMAVLVAAATVQLIVGMKVFDTFLEARPRWFALYWIFCFALVFTIMLLACYDMLAIKRDERVQLQRLRARIFGRGGGDSGEGKNHRG